MKLKVGAEPVLMIEHLAKIEETAHRLLDMYPPAWEIAYGPRGGGLSTRIRGGSTRELDDEIAERQVHLEALATATGNVLEAQKWLDRAQSALNSVIPPQRAWDVAKMPGRRVAEDTRSSQEKLEDERRVDEARRMADKRRAGGAP